jgi:rhodanese-related sulfurtransferase
VSRQVTWKKVQQLMQDDAQLVEVLPKAEYESEHLPGAIHLPLKKLNEETVSTLTKDKPVIVYCHDSQ